MKKIELPLVQFAKAREEAIIPSKTKGNAGYDLYCAISEERDEEIVLQPHETALFPTGLRSIIDKHHYAQVFERGSTGSKGIGFRAGVVDSNYRGEWFVILTNTTNRAMRFGWKEKEDGNGFYDLHKAIAQFVLLPVPAVEIKEISIEDLEANKTERGIGALGSSGK